MSKHHERKIMHNDPIRMASRADASIVRVFPDRIALVQRLICLRKTALAVAPRRGVAVPLVGVEGLP
jgi:hypothetical protein